MITARPRRLSYSNVVSTLAAHLRGEVAIPQRGPHSFGIFSLPQGYRPLGSERFVAAIYSTGGVATIEVEPTGQVSCYPRLSGSSLSGITFRAGV